MARASAHFIRNTTVAQGIIVPNIAFLDNKRAMVFDAVFVETTY